MLVSLCAETVKPGQNLTAVGGNVSFYQVNLVSRITGEGGGGSFEGRGGLVLIKRGKICGSILKPVEVDGADMIAICTPM